MTDQAPRDILMAWMREPDYADFVDTKWLMDWANRRPVDALVALSPQPIEGQKLLPLEPTDEALLNGARSIGITIGMENHIERARHCYRAFMSDEPQPKPTGRPILGELDGPETMKDGDCCPVSPDSQPRKSS